MTEPGTSTTNKDEKESLDQKYSTHEHTCACGETHEHRPGSPSHRESCTSILKFGDTCCCGTGNVPKGDRHRCGHGPRCK